MNLEGKEYFSKNYADYERQSSRRKLEFYVKLVRKWVPQGKTIFELGVGMGHFLQMASKEYVCQGCDINKFGLDKARARVPKAALLEGSFECIDIRTPPFAVIAWDVLEHIERLDDAMAFIYSSLDKYGFLIGIVPVFDGPLGSLASYLDKDLTHIWKLSRTEWIAKLNSHHFTVVDSGGVIRKLLFSRWYLHIIWPQCLLRRIGSAFYFVAQK